MFKVRQKLSKILGKGEKAFNISICALALLLVNSTNAYAETPKLITGTVALFQSLTTWLLLIIPVGAGAMLGYQALQKSLTDDTAVIAEKNKFMKNVLIGAAIAECASGVVTVILSFYA
ncbi:hypothetical protein [Clostridium butyricum]|uniref:hypothetical protein n=1 Tax=Clostridium butyricum TaxID=1492 RepID=UPI00374FB2A5